MTTAPNLDLLKRQRTFSIDETREQLVQGRPVQREAVISGAVDVRSLLFGDESVATTTPAPSNSSSNSKSSSGSGSHPVPSYKAASSGGAKGSGSKTAETPAAVKPSVPTNSSVASKESSTASTDVKVSTTVPSSIPVSTPQPTIDVEAAKPATEVALVTEKEVTEGGGATQNSAAVAHPSIIDGLKSLSTEEKPQKITPSTWAAMVMKSSAAATAESSTQTTVPSRPKQPSSSSDKKPKNGVSQGAAKPLAGANATNGAAPSGSEKDIADKKNSNGSGGGGGNNTSFAKDRERDSRRRSDRPRDREREGAKPAGGAAPASDRRDSKTLPGSRDDNNSKVCKENIWTAK